MMFKVQNPSVLYLNDLFYFVFISINISIICFMTFTYIALSS